MRHMFTSKLAEDSRNSLAEPIDQCETAGRTTFRKFRAVSGMNRHGAQAGFGNDPGLRIQIVQVGESLALVQTETVVRVQK
eukprot:m.305212 g.305212  ORF g.305212 m.305212 type:complete len:81 (-) comp55284_c0_seq2:1868-2110(-)